MIVVCQKIFSSRIKISFTGIEYHYLFFTSNNMKPNTFFVFYILSISNSLENRSVSVSKLTS